MRYKHFPVKPAERQCCLVLETENGRRTLFLPALLSFPLKLGPGTKTTKNIITTTTQCTAHVKAARL